MALLGQVLQPFAEEGVHAQAMVEDALRRRIHADHVLPATTGIAVRRFDLAGQIRPFSRCAACNGLIEPVAKADVLERLEPKTKQYYDTFFRCTGCGKVYWEGSHVARTRARLSSLRNEAFAKPT